MAITKELADAIERMQNKDEKAFAIFYEQTYSYVYAKAKYTVHEEQDALDLTQETYIIAYRGINSIRDINNVYAWLGGIVYRQGMRILNKKNDVLAYEEQEYLFEDIESNDANPEQAADQQATANIVKGMIDELPELQRIAIMSFYYDNMKIDDIADMCECSANTIKSRLNYAKKTLKEMVAVHEKKNRYKLCSISPAIIVLALRGLLSESEYKMPAYAVKSAYTACCNSLGIEAASSVAVASGATTAATETTVSGAATAATEATVSGATTAATEATVSGATTAGAAAAGTAAATTVKAGIGIKLGITAATILAAGGITLGVVHNVNNNTPKEPVAIVEEQTDYEEESSPVGEIEDESQEAIYDESIPMEGLYKYGMYTISITNAIVKDYQNATFDMKLTCTNPDTGVVEKVSATAVKKENGKAYIDLKSNLGNRWFGDLIFLYDNSVRLNLTVHDTSGGAWDTAYMGSVAILTKAGTQDAIKGRMVTEGTYSYTEGNDPETDGGCIVKISNIQGNLFDMEIKLIDNNESKLGENNESDLIDYTDGFIQMNSGIVTFSGITRRNVAIHGYVYVNEDGSIALSYSPINGPERGIWYCEYSDKCLEPIILKKN